MDLFYREPFADVEDRVAQAACRAAFRWLRRRDQGAALEYGIVCNPAHAADQVRKVGLGAIRAHGLRRSLRELRRLELSAYLQACERYHRKRAAEEEPNR